MKQSFVVLVISICLMVACGPDQSETVGLAVTTPESTAPVEQTEVPTEEPAEVPTNTTVPTDEPSPTEEPTMTPEPTATDTPTPEPTYTPEPTEPPSLLERLGLVQGEPDLEILAERLITIESMPAGWSAAAIEIEEKEGEGTYDPFCAEGLPARSIGNVATEFEGGSIFGPFVSESITVYQSVDDAVMSFEEYRQAANDCPEWTDSEGRTISLSPLSFPSYGDESFAVRMNIDGFISDNIRIREGELLVGVMQMGMETDVELQQTLVEEALSKLNQ